MVLDLTELETWWRISLLAIWSIFAVAVGYAKGFTDGRREGILRGKTIGRHAANAVRK